VTAAILVTARLGAAFQTHRYISMVTDASRLTVLVDTGSVTAAVRQAAVSRDATQAHRYMAQVTSAPRRPVLVDTGSVAGAFLALAVRWDAHEAKGFPLKLANTECGPIFGLYADPMARAFLTGTASRRVRHAFQFIRPIPLITSAPWLVLYDDAASAVRATHLEAVGRAR
jgi:hypothetical protein